MSVSAKLDLRANPVHAGLRGHGEGGAAGRGRGVGAVVLAAAPRHQRLPLPHADRQHGRLRPLHRAGRRGPTMNNRY